MKVLSDHPSVKSLLPGRHFDKLDEIKRRRSVRVRWLRMIRYAVAALTVLLSFVAVKFDLLQSFTVGNPDGGFIARTGAGAWAFVMAQLGELYPNLEAWKSRISGLPGYERTTPAHW